MEQSKESPTFCFLFWLLWVFIAAHRQISLVVAIGGSLIAASHCDGVSCRGAWFLGVWASVAVARGLRSSGSWALEHRLNSCKAQARSLHGLWELTGQGSNLCLLHWQVGDYPRATRDSQSNFNFELS